MPAATAKAIARRAGLRLVRCERGLGLLPLNACAARSLVAQGKAPGDSGIRQSACCGCPHGKRRAAKLGGKVLTRRDSDRPPSQRRRSWRPKQKAPRPVVVRVCGREGCGQKFEVRNVSDANRRYHSEECRQLAQAIRPLLVRVQCSTPGCAGTVESSRGGNDRRCDTCRAKSGELRFRQKAASC